MFSALFHIDFHQKSLFVYLRAEAADMRNMQHSPHEKLFFQGALCRGRRKQYEDSHSKTQQEMASENDEILNFFVRQISHFYGDRLNWLIIRTENLTKLFN